MKNKLTPPTVYSLRKNGSKVRVIHRRFYRVFDEMERRTKDVLLSRFEATAQLSPIDVERGLLPKGGETVIELTTPEGDNFRGVAECSLSDHFNRKTGLLKAIGRTLASTKELALTSFE